jgi:L-malate glycosyltransferase
MKSIHQFVAGYSRGDAISNEAAVLRDLFRSWGHSSEIYSEHRRILPELRNDARDICAAARQIDPDDVVLLHLSIGSVVNEIFAQLPCRKAILYHNITPASYLRGIQEEVAAHLARGREQAAQLAQVAELNMADSAYNAQEFRDMGCPHVEVLPLVLNLQQLRQGSDRRQYKMFADGKINVLFVGRCAPNKRIEDVLQAFCYFQRYVQPDSRLILAGSYNGMESYQAYQVTLQKELKLRDVVFTGSIPQTWLNACYRAAHVFVCMSEHEGFCIPVLESMAMDVPVLAYAAAAVPETMNGAGVLVKVKQYDAIAEMMGQLANPAPFREAILQGQRERISRYEARDLAAELRALFGAIRG